MIIRFLEKSLFFSPLCVPPLDKVPGLPLVLFCHPSGSVCVCDLQPHLGREEEQFMAHWHGSVHIPEHIPCPTAPGKMN